jgi:hypothetical protein
LGPGGGGGGGYLEEAAVFSGAVEVIGCAAGAFVAPQGRTLLGASLAFYHAPPPGGIPRPLHITPGGHVDLPQHLHFHPDAEYKFTASSPNHTGGCKNKSIRVDPWAICNAGQPELCSLFVGVPSDDDDRNYSYWGSQV